MFVRTYDTLQNPPITVAQLIVGPGTAGALTLGLVVQGGQIGLAQTFVGADGGEQTTTAMIAKIASGQWVALDLLLDRGTTTWAVTVLVDGGSKFVEEPSATPSNQNLEVDLGMIGVLPPTTANAITFDNVTVRAF